MNQGMSRIIVLGASGQVGSVLYHALTAIPHLEVTGTSRTGQRGLSKFDPFSDDWTTLGKANVLINCVGIIQEDKEYTFKKIHIDLTKKLLANRHVVGNPRVIQISALGADVSHEVDFLRTKGEADDHLMQFDNVVVVRPSIIGTQRTMLIRKILLLKKLAKLTGGLLFLPTGFAERKIQPIMPEDLAAIVADLIQSENLPKVLNAVGPEPLRYGDIISKMTGRRYRIIEIPKIVTDVLVKYIIDPFLPRLVNAQQYRLLFTDNTADASAAQARLTRPMHSTISFWKQELK